MAGEGDVLQNWSSRVEELVDEDNTEGAVKLLEDVIAKLEILNNANINLTLAAALNDVGRLYANQGLSIKADSFFTKALLIKQRAQQSGANLREEQKNGTLGGPNLEENEKSKEIPTGEASRCSDEDWETITDQAQKPSICSQVTAGVSKLSLEDQFQTPKQRGRGAFTYGQSALYSDQPSESTTKDRALDEALHEDTNEPGTTGDLKYGIGHVLVIGGFPPKVSTRELEHLFEGFIRSGVVVRRINDTVALAVFRNPASAREALSSIHSQYSIRAFDENDTLLSSLSAKDLEPPFPRPATSAQTAQRMIMGALRSQGLNKKVSPKCNFNDVQKQEEERKNRILMRQRLRDEAWGPDH